LLEARYGLSSVCAKIGDLNGAIALLRQVIEAMPDFGEPRYNLGLDLWNRYRNAAGFRQKSDLDEAIDALKAASRLEPRDPKSHAALGQLLAETQNLDPAIEHLRTAVDLAPADAEHSYNLGLALRLKGDLDAAERQFRAATQRNAQHALAYRALGLVLRQKEHYDEAASELRRSLTLRPGDAQGHHVLGTVLLKLDRAPEALVELREAIRLDEGLTEARVTLAQTLAKAGRMDEARLEQAAIQEMKADNARDGQTLVLLQTASDRMKKGEGAAAVAQLREAAALSPRFEETHFQLGLALEHAAADTSEAESAFRRALTLNPDHAAAHYRLGVLLMTRGNVQGAAVALRRATEIEPGLVEARRALARLSLDARDWTTAIAELQKALAWTPLSAAAHFDLAVGLQGRGDVEAAAREFAIAQRLKPQLRVPNF
jgi:tetratricopeptide (TPR) repeat protein